MEHLKDIPKPKIEIEFDEVWSLGHNLRFIKDRVLEIRKRSRSVHVKELLIDEHILEAIRLSEKIIRRYTHGGKSDE